MKIRKIAFPKNSILSDIPYDYADSYSGDLNKQNRRINAVDVGHAFFTSSPKWVGHLMELRNKLVSVFGLKTGTELSREEFLNRKEKFNKGDQIGIFKVYDKNDIELILGEDDKHLNFRVSLFLVPNAEHKETLIISTIVIFNNWFGKLYFLPVKIFHKFIVKNMLKKTIQSL